MKNGPKMEPKCLPEFPGKSRKPTPKRPRSRTTPHGPPKSAPGRPPDPQRAPRDAHQTPKGPPKDPQRAPKAPQRTPKGLPKHLQRTPNDAKDAQRTSKDPQATPRDPKDPRLPKTHLKRSSMEPKIQIRIDATAVTPAAPLTPLSNYTAPIMTPARRNARSD